MKISHSKQLLIFALPMALLVGPSCGSRNTESINDGSGGADSFVTEAGTVDNSRCARASRLPLSGGSVTVSSSTAGFSNEYGTQVNCGASFNTMLGPQVYYRVVSTKDQSYVVAVTPDFSYAKLYVFGFTCSATQINTDCASKGKSGDVYSGFLTKGKSSTLTFKPTASGQYIIAVDATSDSSYGFGTFALQVTEK